MSSREIGIDEFNPEAGVMSVDDDKSAWFRHGGVVTRFDWTSVERMDLEAFRKTEVPKMGADDCLYVVRNSAGGTYHLVLGDCVLKYRISGMEETDEDTLAKYLSREEQAWSCSLPYPIVHYSSNTSKVSMTMSVPAERRKVRVSDRRSVNEHVEEVEIETPPFWFKVEMSPTGALQGAYVSVVPERSIPWDSTRMMTWILPHAQGSSGHLCLGSSEFEQAPPELPGFTEFERTLWFTYLRFFGAKWNSDLFNSAAVRNLSKVVAELKPGHESWMEEHKWLVGYNGTLASVMFVLSFPDGWKKLEYLPTGLNGREFANGR